MEAGEYGSALSPQGTFARWLDRVAYTGTCAAGPNRKIDVVFATHRAGLHCSGAVHDVPQGRRGAQEQPNGPRPDFLSPVLTPMYGALWALSILSTSTNVGPERFPLRWRSTPDRPVRRQGRLHRNRSSSVARPSSRCAWGRRNWSVSDPEGCAGARRLRPSPRPP